MTKMGERYRFQTVSSLVYCSTHRFVALNEYKIVARFDIWSS
jgi:hypothetical protein